MKPEKKANVLKSVGGAVGGFLKGTVQGVGSIVMLPANIVMTAVDGAKAANAPKTVCNTLGGEGSRDFVYWEKEGWIYKRGVAKFSHHQKRWFKLSGTALVYFDDDSKLKCKGYVDLQGAEIVSTDDNDGKAFEIVTPQRTFWVYTEAKTQKEDWIKALRYNIDFKENFAQNVKRRNEAESSVADLERLVSDSQQITDLKLESTAKKLEELEAKNAEYDQNLRKLRLEAKAHEKEKGEVEAKLVETEEQLRGTIQERDGKIKELETELQALRAAIAAKASPKSSATFSFSRALTAKSTSSESAVPSPPSSTTTDKSPEEEQKTKRRGFFGRSKKT